MIMIADYNEAFDWLRHLLLEDSWLLQDAFSRDELAFRIEAVLLPEHALFKSPRPGERDSYQPAWMRIRGSKPVRRSCRPAPVTHRAAEAVTHQAPMAAIRRACSSTSLPAPPGLGVARLF